jgi:hypothetical protein
MFSSLIFQIQNLAFLMEKCNGISTGREKRPKNWTSSH